jgi:hypothetical protein
MSKGWVATAAAGTAAVAAVFSITVPTTETTKFFQADLRSNGRLIDICPHFPGESDQKKCEPGDHATSNYFCRKNQFDRATDATIDHAGGPTINIISGNPVDVPWAQALSTVTCEKDVTALLSTVIFRFAGSLWVTSIQYLNALRCREQLGCNTSSISH